MADLKEYYKEILLLELCARMPYGVKVAVNYKGVYKINSISSDGIVSLNTIGPLSTQPIENVVPYLFTDIKPTYDINLHDILNENDEELFDRLFDKIDGYINWSYRHHYDCFNIIGEGLAIDCTNLNIY